MLSSGFMDNTFVLFVLPAENVEKLSKFYQELFGCKFVHSPIPDMDYWVIHTVPIDDQGMPERPGINGGMYVKENAMQIPTNWISVEAIDVYSKKLVDLGGKIIVEKMEIPDIGWTAVGIDPEGNQVAMLQPAMP